jgi:ribosomal protein S18 acetylase RimI-like enzyme
MTCLQTMRAQSYPAYLEAAIHSYAQDNVAARRWEEVGAMERSRADFAALLPQGLATPGHSLYEIVANEGGPVIGHLWLAIERRAGSVSAFVYDLEVRPEHRRQGHAARALQALEPIASSAGASGIALNVFINNEAARALYRQLGYVETNVNMRKALASRID